MGVVFEVFLGLRVLFFDRVFFRNFIFFWRRKLGVVLVLCECVGRMLWGECLWLRLCFMLLRVSGGFCRSMRCCGFCIMSGLCFCMRFILFFGILCLLLRVVVIGSFFVGLVIGFGILRMMWLFMWCSCYKVWIIFMVVMCCI